VADEEGPSRGADRAVARLAPRGRVAWRVHGARGAGLSGSTAAASAAHGVVTWRRLSAGSQPAGSRLDSSRPARITAILHKTADPRTGPFLAGSTVMVGRAFGLAETGMNACVTSRQVKLIGEVVGGLGFGLAAEKLPHQAGVSQVVEERVGDWRQQQGQQQAQ
jgi:hypothetical protein